MHDVYIKNVYDNLWPRECEEIAYTGLNTFLCFPCSKEQPRYTDEDSGVMRICQSLLEGVYGSATLTEKPSAYKSCGIEKVPDPELVPYLKTEKDGSKKLVWKIEQPDTELQYANLIYKDAAEFFGDFEPMAIPFMGDFNIQAIPDMWGDSELKPADGGDETEFACYKNAVAVAVSSLALAAAVTMHTL